MKVGTTEDVDISVRAWNVLRHLDYTHQWGLPYCSWGGPEYVAKLKEEIGRGSLFMRAGTLRYFGQSIRNCGKVVSKELWALAMGDQMNESQINHEQYQLNRDGFLQAAHNALLYRMLAVLGYHPGTPEFDQVRREALKRQTEEILQQYAAIMKESWMGESPKTVIGAQVEEQLRDAGVRQVRWAVEASGLENKEKVDEQ